MLNFSEVEALSDEKATDNLEMRVKPSDKERMARAAELDGRQALGLRPGISRQGGRAGSAGTPDHCAFGAGPARAAGRARQSAPADEGRPWTRFAATVPGLPMQGNGGCGSGPEVVIEPFDPDRHERSGFFLRNDPPGQFSAVQRQEAAEGRFHSGIRRGGGQEISRQSPWLLRIERPCRRNGRPRRGPSPTRSEHRQHPGGLSFDDRRRPKPAGQGAGIGPGRRRAQSAPGMPPARSGSNWLSWT